MGDFLQELKRRNVFRVGVAYLIVSWLVVQIVETVSEPLGLPEWSVAFFIVLMAVGFPIAVIFAWAFELTPEGIKKTQEVEKEKSVTAMTGKKLNNAIIVALVLALGYFVVERQFLHDHGDETGESAIAAEEAAGTSIAVLPFVNMSAEAEQEFFSDGISEELLNLLAKIPELRVAARTSSFQFKGQNLNIGEVAEQLNVKHVLEGSVRKANTRVRITAQLIEADTGYHLWSDTYDRELTDVFGIQDEISAAIVAALSTTLGLVPENAPQTHAATNAQAYDAYLLGQHLIKKRTRPDIEAALEHFERAVELDPDYAPAQASMGLAAYLLTSSASTYGDFTLDESLSVAEPAVDRALELDPELADAHAIKGLLLYARHRNEEAVPYFEEALRLNPSQTDARNWYSAMLNEMSRPAEAFEIQEAAYAIDPLSVLTLNNYVNELMLRRRHEEIEPLLDRFESLDPSRAAQFRGFMLNQQRKAAEGAITMLRGADLDPGAHRQQATASFSVSRLGLRDEAMRIWPYPNAERIFVNFEEPEQWLPIAMTHHENSPGDADTIPPVAFAYLLSGDAASAKEWANRYLEQLDVAQRPTSFINDIFAIDAWRRGASDELEQIIVPMEQAQKIQSDAGLDRSSMYINEAWWAQMRGDADSAAVMMEKALSRNTVRLDELDLSYRIMGWDQDPRMLEIKAEYDDYVASERSKFLAYACGEVGFQLWKPLDSTCKEVEKASPVPL